MSKTYQPLATKYRPQTFEDVVGQEVVTTTLKNALSQSRISHAYLFSGMRGVGKTTTARLLAKCLNCNSSDSPTTEPCGTCDSCKEITAGRSIDVIEIDAASNTSVDDVRALQENLIYSPARDRYKVYIVDEVHMLSKSAFNAFLKTLEEPPAHVVFIFATTEMNRIPPTVLSRCLIFDFGRVSSASISARLHWICEQEEVSAEEAAIDLIVFQSEGSIRDAISALDQVINFSGGNISYEQALKALGVIDRDILHRLMESIIEQDAARAFSLVNEVSGIGADIRLFGRHLMRHVRDLMVTKVSGKTKELLPYSEKEIELLANQSQKVSEEDLNRFFDILVRADDEMQLAATPQYHLESALVKMIHSTRLLPLVDLLAQLQKGEVSLPAVKPREIPREQSLKFNESAQTYSSANPKNTKDALLKEVEGSRVYSLLKMANPVTKEGKNIHIKVASETFVKTLSEAANKSTLMNAARKIYGDDIQITISNGGAKADLDDDEEPARKQAPAQTEKAEKELPSKPSSANHDLEEAEKIVRQDDKAKLLFENLPIKIKNVRSLGEDEEN